MVYEWLSDETNGRWIVVVDNADDTNIMFEPWNEWTITNTTAASTSHSLSEYLPFSPNGSIVITSRSHEIVERLQVFSEDILNVGPMEVDVAQTLLLKKLKKAERGVSPDDMVRLVKHLDCMPLAITQAAAYTDQSAPRITVSKYTDILANNDSERVVLLQKDIQDPRRDRQASNSVIMTWHVTFTHLRQARDSAARLLALMSLFDREAIPDHLLRGRYAEAQDSQIDFEDDVMTLKPYNLIGVDISGNLFDMHRLVQLSTRKWLEIYVELHGWQERYINILDAAFPSGDYANWMTRQALFPHVEAMETYLVTSVDQLQALTKVLHNGAWYAIERGQYCKADKLARKSLEARQEVLGFNGTATLDSINMLSLLLRIQGKYELTEEMNRRALSGREKVLGVDHLDTLTSVYCLAHLLNANRDHREALDLYQRAVVGYNKALGPDNPTTIACQRHKAMLLEKMK